ncbi:type III pantothenate kinase [Bowmanella sp. Y26]|uniref:type III pantothenate kinase n=1 Tax=Bowmanella yangjiangensis TaxID=2811230 RepID=UPI001BDCCA7C|nr:type III pantothenate kinase [Bowmanella yangjiangensis]
MSEVSRVNWLFIDAGNSCIKAASYSAGAMTMLGVIESHCQLSSILAQVDAILIASVGQRDWVNELQERCRTLNVPCFEVEVKRSFLGIENLYENIQQMGCDRWLAVIGASTLTDGPFVIADFGTAINVEFVDEQRNYIGGWIAPGIQLLYSSLFKGTDKVKGQLGRSLDLKAGKNTQKAVDSGCAAAAAGILTMAIQQAEDLGDNPVIFVCGGDFVRIEQLTDKRVRHESALVFLGMQEYAEQIALKCG